MSQVKYLYKNTASKQEWINCEILGKQNNKYIIRYRDPVNCFTEIITVDSTLLEFPKFSEYGAL